MNTGRGSFPKYIALISLMFSFTNYIPVSAAISGLALALYPFSFAANRTSRVVMPLVFLFVYTVISTVLYDASSLFNYDFYRRDGNFFITMTPLLFLASTVFYADVERILKWFIYVSTFINLCVFTAWVATGGLAVLRNFATEESYTEIYYMLFVAHNAAGGFLAVLCTFSLALFINRRSMLTAGVVVLNVATLIASNSRGSMLGVAIAVILVFFTGRLKEKFYWLMVPALAANFLMALYVYNKSDIHLLTTQRVVVTEVIGRLTPGIADSVDSNTSNRLEVLWPLAIHSFFQSPIFGIGFGAYDDQPWKFIGWPGVFAFNDSPKIFHSDSHAHNTYFNVLAETGAVGLILLLWFLNRLFNFICGLSPGLVRNALLLSFWACVMASFTEHRLFTPSQMMPFVIIVGMTIAHHRFLSEANASAPLALEPALAGSGGR
jgi:O-antigen ligase